MAKYTWISKKHFEDNVLWNLFGDFKIITIKRVNLRPFYMYIHKGKRVAWWFSGRGGLYKR